MQTNNKSFATGLIFGIACFVGVAASRPAADIMPVPSPYESVNNETPSGSVDREAGGQAASPVSPAPDTAPVATPAVEEPQSEYVTEYVTEMQRVCEGDRCFLRPVRVARQVIRKTARVAARVTANTVRAVAGVDCPCGPDCTCGDNCQCVAQTSVSYGSAGTVSYSAPVVTSSYQVYDAGPVSYGSQGTSYTTSYSTNTPYSARMPVRMVMAGDGPVRRLVRCVLGR